MSSDFAIIIHTTVIELKQPTLESYTRHISPHSTWASEFVLSSLTSKCADPRSIYLQTFVLCVRRIMGHIVYFYISPVLGIEEISGVLGDKSVSHFCGGFVAYPVSRLWRK